jgi:hypothetical protein
MMGGVAGVVEVVIAVVVVVAVAVADDGDDGGGGVGFGGGMGGAAHGGGFGGPGDGFPNRRRAERLLCIKSACDRLLHSEELFTRVPDSTPAWQGRRSLPLGLIVKLTRWSYGIRLALALRINGPSASKCFGPIASISVQLQHSTMHIAP